MQAQNGFSVKIRDIFPRWLRISLLATVFILAVERAALAVIRSNPEYQPGMASMTADTIMPIPTQALTMMPTQTPTLLPIPTMSIISTMVSDVDNMTMVYVPAGEFEMGSEDGDDDESPVHTVYLDAFWIDQTEVTNFQYEMCVNAGGCRVPPESNLIYDNDSYDHPVVNINWLFAEDYCQWVGRKLPTEAQWEKAARGTDGRTYPWGEGIDCSHANYGKCNEFTSTSPVGYYGAQGASLYGVYDMVGNVSEWVADYYSDTYFQNSPYENPIGPGSGDKRVIRGESFSAMERNIRLSNRNMWFPDLEIWWENQGFGFRCAMDVEMVGQTDTSITNNGPANDLNNPQKTWMLDSTTNSATDSVLDVISGEASLDGQTLTVTLTFRDVPETLTIDREGIRDSTTDYQWSIPIDTNANGVNYELGIYKWYFAGNTTREINLNDPITWAERVLYQKVDGRWEYETTDVIASFDPTANTLTLSVSHEDFNTEMRLSVRNVSGLGDFDSAQFY